MKNNPRNDRRRNVSYGIVGAAFLVIGFLFALLINTPTSSHSQMSSMQPLSAEAYQIAAKFDCPCGACTKAVTTCECPQATEMKNFIVQKLNQGQKPSDIVSAVAKTYVPPVR